MRDPTGTQALLDPLTQQGTRHLSGIPGVHTLPLHDARAGCLSIRPIVTRHEAGAAFAADGYVLLTGRPGVVSVVPGPVQVLFSVRVLTESVSEGTSPGLSPATAAIDPTPLPDRHAYRLEQMARVPAGRGRSQT